MENMDYGSGYNQYSQNGETLLYRVTDAGFAPVEMEVTR